MNNIVNKTKTKISSQDDSKNKAGGGKLAQEISILKKEHRTLFFIVVGVIFLIVLEFLGISYDIAKNDELNERVNQLEKENISRNLIFIENTKMQSGVKDDLKNLENVNNIIFCLSSKKYWQYQECFNNKK